MLPADMIGDVMAATLPAAILVLSVVALHRVIQTATNFLRRRF